MKVRFTKERLQSLVKIIFFLCAITIILQMMPRQNSFKYQFQTGRPWVYELITAPFDFPIYKDAKVYVAERADVLRDFIPYYVSNKAASRKMMQSVSDYLSKTYSISPACKDYVKAQLDKICTRGIVSTDEMDSLRIHHYAFVYVVDSLRQSHQIAAQNLFTVKSAYAFIFNNKPSNVDAKSLNLCNINYFLTENLAYERNLSDRERNSLLAQVSLTEGKIQAGERIVDRGEIVTAHTFQLLNSLKIEMENQRTSLALNNHMWAGEILLVTGLMTLLFFYIYLFRPNIFESVKNVIFILLMVLLSVLMVSATLRFTTLNVFIVPIALLPIIVRTFFDSRTALFVHIIATLIIASMLPNSFEYVLVQITGGMAAVSILKDLTQRAQLVQAAIIIFVDYIVMYVGYTLLVEGDIQKIDVHYLGYFGISAFLLLFDYGLIYVFEKMFGFISNVSLMELSNVNSGLMQKFAEVAPGSFQHSLQVATLVTEASKKINANTLLVRIGALYHDIGKMSNPSFFTENQLTGINPLIQLDYVSASKLIINHVNEGVKIAEKNGLPEVIVDFIRTHHGDGLTKYFYNSYCNEHPDERIDENMFRYKGPSPTTKEQALLMMADAVEAASRSLKSYMDDSISMLVNKMIDKQIADGLLKNAHITFANVETVKSVFKEKLKTIYHTRVSYPELTEQAASINDETK